LKAKRKAQDEQGVKAVALWNM